MNFEAIEATLLQIKEIKPIGKTLDIGGVISHVMGIILLADGTMLFLVLVYDNDYREKAEQAEIDVKSGVYNRPETNRDQQSGRPNVEPPRTFAGTTKICLGELEFTSSESSNAFCSAKQWDNVVLFTRFLLHGWKPLGIRVQDMDYIHMTRIIFDGRYNSIPEFEESAPIRFTMRPTNEQHFVEKSITLLVGGEYEEKLYFSDEETEQQHWIQINRVYLYDIWEEMGKIFSNPRVTEHLSKKKLEQRKAGVEADLLVDCPKGMYYLAVDYESESDISVRFHSRRWLEAIPKQKNHVMGILSKPDQTTGKLGMKLKTAIIQESLPSDTKEIEAELFCYNVSITKDDIVI